MSTWSTNLVAARQTHLLEVEAHSAKVISDLRVNLDMATKKFEASQLCNDVLTGAEPLHTAIDEAYDEDWLYQLEVAWSEMKPCSPQI